MVVPTILGVEPEQFLRNLAKTVFFMALAWNPPLRRKDGKLDKRCKFYRITKARQATLDGNP